MIQKHAHVLLICCLTKRGVDMVWGPFRNIILFTYNKTMDLHLICLKHLPEGLVLLKIRLAL